MVENIHRMVDYYKDLNAALNQLCDKLDALALRFNTSKGQAVLLKEMNDVNRSMRDLEKAWKRLHGSEVWIDQTTSKE